MTPPAPEPRRRLRLTTVAVLAASVSGVGILLHAAGWLPLYFTADVLGAPSVALLLWLGVRAGRIHEPVFLDRLRGGVWIGLVATLAYDGLRYVLWATGALVFDPFRSHPIFGELITGYPRAGAVAHVVGWVYHFWNGIAFAIMYTLVAGPAHWAYGFGWAMLLEVAWLAALPSTLRLDLSRDMVVLSLVGHGAYGVVLGLLAERRISA